MENDEIEELAVNIIEQEILKYSDLKSGIPKGDKGISWDGYITVFDGKGRNKSNFEYNINVQVKGRKVNKIRKGNNKFAIEKAHLINYQKQKNGTLLLVVDIIDRLNYQIYYANLLPVDLKQLIENNTSKAKKPKVSILIRPVKESSSSSLNNICKNFVLNSKMQMGIPIKDLSELKKVKSVEFKVIAEKGKHFDYILNNDVYEYAILDDELRTMVALPKGDLIMIQNTIQGNIQINNKIFYSSYLLTRHKEYETITIGKGITFNLNNRKIHFDFQGTLQERIKDMEFFVNLIKYRTVTINGAILYLVNDNVDKKKIIGEYQDKITDLKILRDKFLEMKIDFKEDIDKLDKKDKNNLLLFKKIFCDNEVPVNLNIRPDSIYYIKIGNCYIAILAQKEKNSKLKIYNYFENLNNVINIVVAKEGEKLSDENRTSPYFIMNCDDVLKYSNFNADVIFASLSLIKNYKNQFGYINAFMLELLKAYDKNNKRQDIFNLAKKINDLLMQQELNITNQLNNFQIIKRKRNLEDIEKNNLIDLRNNLETDDFFNQCGIAILLENKADYDYYYNLMDKTEKDLFNEFPIVHLK